MALERLAAEEFHFIYGRPLPKDAIEREMSLWACFKDNHYFN